MGRYNHSLSLDGTIMVSKHFPIIGKQVVIIFVTEQVTIATVQPAETLLITALETYNSKLARCKFFILSTFNKHDKTQLLAKFKNFCG